MGNPFIRRLEGDGPLPGEHRRALEALTARPQAFGPREDVVRGGDELRTANVVMSGWACRYKILPDGRRQIVALFLPGDLCDPYVPLLGAVDRALGTLTAAAVAKVPAQALRALMAEGAGFAEALWGQAHAAVEIQREWAVSVGRRSALERIAHLFCEVAARLAAVGLSDGAECEMPLTQSDLADTLGLSTVHVNRVLQELRASGLIELRNRRLALHDPAALADIAMFDPAYLRRRGS